MRSPLYNRNPNNIKKTLHSLDDGIASSIHLVVYLCLLTFPHVFLLSLHLINTISVTFKIQTKTFLLTSVTLPDCSWSNELRKPQREVLRILFFI